MDRISIETLRSFLAQDGYNGSFEELFSLVVRAKTDSEKRSFLEIRSKAEKSSRFSVTKSIFSHARKHSMMPIFNADDDGEITIACISGGFNVPGVRIGIVNFEIYEKGWARLMFYRGKKWIGEKKFKLPVSGVC